MIKELYELFKELIKILHFNFFLSFMLSYYPPHCSSDPLTFGSFSLPVEFVHSGII